MTDGHEEAALPGWPEVDYDPEIWLAIPVWFGAGTPWPDHRAWAREMAESCWADSAQSPGEYEVDNLALTLAMCAERFGPDLQDPDAELDGQTFLHLPHPRLMPLPVDVRAARDPAGDLWALVVADDPDAVGQVEIDPIDTDALGSGLRAFRRRVLPPADGATRGDGPVEQYAVLRYAWHLKAHGVSIAVAASADPERILAARADIDALVRAVSWLRS